MIPYLVVWSSVAFQSSDFCLVARDSVAVFDGRDRFVKIQGAQEVVTVRFGFTTFVSKYPSLSYNLSINTRNLIKLIKTSGYKINLNKLAAANSQKVVFCACWCASFSVM